MHVINHYNKTMEPIILIGPIGAGKTTVGKLLAQKLSLPFYSLDEEAPRYTVPLGYSDDHYDLLKKQKGPFAAYDYAREFFDEAVLQFLAAHDQGIFDFGGGHPVVPDIKKQERIVNALKPYSHIFFLMPTSDIEESLSILRKRNELSEDEADFNTLYFKDKTYWEIAKFIIYTEGKSPEQTCEEILEKGKFIMN
jgi:shikimate kinase